MAGKQPKPSYVETDARFDDKDDRFRYLLIRTWDRALPVLVWIMLNPSTADAKDDDHTITKCVGFAQRLGYGGIVVVNMFAWRARDPKELAKASDPVGPMNDGWIDAAVRRGKATICAWGPNAGRFPWRIGEVMNLLRRLISEGMPRPMALKISQGGHPCHPLMLPYSLVPQPWDF